MSGSDGRAAKIIHSRSRSRDCQDEFASRVSVVDSYKSIFTFQLLQVEFDKHKDRFLRDKIDGIFTLNPIENIWGIVNTQCLTEM